MTPWNGRGRNFRVVSAFTVLQQGTAAVTGILIVRALSKTEYAQYSVAVALLSAIAVIADAGVVSTILSRGGPIVDDPARFLPLVRAARRVRWIASGVAAVAALPVAVYTIGGSGAEGTTLVALLVTVVAGSFATATSGIYASVLRLQRRFSAVGLVLAGSAMVRLVVVVVALAVGGPLRTSVTFLAVTAALVLVEAVVLRALVGPLPAADEQRRIPYARDFLRNGVWQVPNSLLYVAQGQVLPVVLVTVGNPAAIADVNALGRYSLAFAVVQTIVSQVAMTAIAREADAGRLASVVARTSALYLGVAVAGLGLVALLADPLLALLGAPYAGLRAELVLVATAALVNGLIGVMMGLNQARAWLRLVWVQIPLTVIWIGVLIAVIPIQDTASAAWFQLLVGIPGLVTMVLCAVTGLAADRRRAG